MFYYWNIGQEVRDYSERRSIMSGNNNTRLQGHVDGMFYFVCVIVYKTVWGVLTYSKTLIRMTYEALTFHSACCQYEDCLLLELCNVGYFSVFYYWNIEQEIRDYSRRSIMSGNINTRLRCLQVFLLCLVRSLDIRAYRNII